MGDKEKKGNTKRDKGTQSKTQNKIISAQHPDTPWEHAMGDKEGQGKTKTNKGTQSKIISTQHPNTLWETRGAGGDKGRGIILAQHRFYSRIGNPSQQNFYGEKVGSKKYACSLRVWLVFWCLQGLCGLCCCERLAGGDPVLVGARRAQPRPRSNPTFRHMFLCLVMLQK